MRRELAGWLGLVVLAALFGGLGWWWGQRAALPAEKPLPPGVIVVEIGGIVPEIRLPELSGSASQALARPGRSRLINYWASWCGPCRKEMPVLDEFSRQQGANGIEVIGIAMDSAADARAYLRTTPVAFTLLIEPASGRDSSVQLGNRRGALPYSVLIDAEGRLRKSHYGAFPDLAAVTAWGTDVP